MAGLKSEVLKKLERGRQFPFRCTPQEKKYIKLKAKEQGVKEVHFVRACVFPLDWKEELARLEIWNRRKNKGVVE